MKKLIVITSLILFPLKVFATDWETAYLEGTPQSVYGGTGISWICNYKTVFGDEYFQVRMRQFCPFSVKYNPFTREVRN